MRLELPRDRDFDAEIWYSTPASSWYPAHWHDELELKLVLWGRVCYQIGAERLELGPGSLLWLAPGQEHALLGLSDDLAMWVTSFRVHAVHGAEKSSGVRVLDRSFTWGSRVLPAAQVQELSTLSATLAQCRAPSDVNPLSQRILARALGAWQARARPADAHGSGTPPRLLHPAVTRARSLLRGAGADLSLDSVSRRCGLASSRLSRLFKRQMGLSIVQFRNHFRVQQFISRLGRGEQASMLHVALAVGFGSYPQFHRAFHQVTGYAPAEHLRRVREGIVVRTYQGLAAGIEPGQTRFE